MTQQHLMKEAPIFQRYLGALKQYTDREGTSVMPEKHSENFNGESLNLGKWCSHRRSEKRAGTLIEHKKKELDGLSFDWEPFRKK